MMIYTVNHKKRDILFLTITLVILTDFYSFYFYIILIVRKFYKMSRFLWFTVYN